MKNDDPVSYPAAVSRFSERWSRSRARAGSIRVDQPERPSELGTLIIGRRKERAQAREATVEHMRVSMNDHALAHIVRDLVSGMRLGDLIGALGSGEAVRDLFEKLDRLAAHQQRKTDNARSAK